MTGLDALTGLPNTATAACCWTWACWCRSDAALHADACRRWTSRIVEWRALTVALLDRIADAVRARARRRRASSLPLARVLEGGTWAAGRRIAAERRAGRRAADRASTATARCSETCHRKDEARMNVRTRHRRRPPAGAAQADPDARQGHAAPSNFRRLLREIGMLLAYEVTRDLPLELIDDRDADGADEGAAARAARSCASSRSCAPAAASSTACWSSCRRRASATSASTATRRRCSAVEYYFKVPDDIGARLVIVVDPMLATGNSAIAAVTG